MSEGNRVRKEIRNACKELKRKIRKRKGKKKERAKGPSVTNPAEMEQTQERKNRIQPKEII